MVLKLHGASMSTCTRLVGAICNEKDIPYELVPVDMANKEHKTSKYLDFQPFGQVPYIDDDGIILYECRAICRYLIKKYPSQGTQGLIPTDPVQEALFEQAASVEASNYNAFAAPIVYEKLVKPKLGFVPDQAKIGENMIKLEEKLDAYDVILGRQKYVAGNNLTLADLQHLPYGAMLYLGGYGDLFEKRPNLLRWWHDISNRPAWQAVKNGA